ncbi:MAG: hypothetical protein M3Q23_05715 [Actinomycetota bacterium]|nr:hypothetical protein [Actinomycetota bacterium]
MDATVATAAIEDPGEQFSLQATLYLKQFQPEALGGKHHRVVGREPGRVAFLDQGVGVPSAIGDGVDGSVV